MTIRQTSKTKDSIDHIPKKQRHMKDSSGADRQNTSGLTSSGMTDKETTDGCNSLTFYADLAEARDITDFSDRILGIVNSMGFSDFGFVRGNCTEDQLPLLSIPQALTKAYFEAGLYEHDFLDQYKQRNSKPIFTSWLYHHAIEAPFDIDTFRVNREILELNQSFGYFDHYITLMKSSHNSEEIIFSVTHRGEEPTRFQQRASLSATVLKLLCQAIDYVSVSKFPSHFLNPEDDQVITINPQPLRVLSALANKDMTITQLADELCISSVTVHHHINSARKALGTRTNIGAIKKAIKLGLLTYD